MTRCLKTWVVMCIFIFMWIHIFDFIVEFYRNMSMFMYVCVINDQCEFLHVDDEMLNNFINCTYSRVLMCIFIFMWIHIFDFIVEFYRNMCNFMCDQWSICDFLCETTLIYMFPLLFFLQCLVVFSNFVATF